MPFMTQFRTFFISPFGEPSSVDELNGFLRSHRIINVEKRLIDGERGTGWLFLVEYGADKSQQGAGQGQQRVDYREILSAEDYAVFDRLRTLRKEAAEKQGVPVYAVFTNEHLAAIVKKKPKTEKDLLSIPGIGEARVKQFGEQFLKVFGGAEQDEEDRPPF
jgi:superfamily II DNA helicase RecQ